MALPDAVWHLDGDTAIPTALARGPWSPHAQHGGAPSALLAGMLERFEPGPADFTARLNIDLMRPVPIAPLRVMRSVIRPGKKVQIVQGSLFADDVEVVRATALRIRTVSPRYDGIAPSDLLDPLPAPTESAPFPFLEDRDVGFWNTVELRSAIGTFGAPAPRTPGEPPSRTAVWFRLKVPVIAGEEPSPLQRVAAVADFGNGLGMAVDRTRYSFINPDLTIVLHRIPEGEWVALDGSSYAEDTGIGVAESELHDERGRLGRGMQTIILDQTDQLFLGRGA
ncbi:MAG TPA: thioesterase family protein [Acidimicrobiia bacterium]|nr:thioesterase family protein [Acidimicrobiia bacterium]